MYDVIMLNYRIEGWLEDEQRWYEQEGGNNSLDGIMKNWQSWTKHSPHTHYRLILIVTNEVILEDTEYKNV